MIETSKKQGKARGITAKVQINPDQAEMQPRHCSSISQNQIELLQLCLLSVDMFFGGEEGERVLSVKYFSCSELLPLRFCRNANLE